MKSENQFLPLFKSKCYCTFCSCKLKENANCIKNTLSSSSQVIFNTPHLFSTKNLPNYVKLIEITYSGPLGNVFPA